MRTRHEDPEIPESVKESDLDRIARNELKTLTKENAEWVARHMVMAAGLIDEDPELAHQHATSAARRAGRIGVVRETLAVTAYATGDYNLALRELRTFRRITGSNEQLPLMVDSERAVGRPERALELGRSVDASTLSTPSRVALAIAMSGARLDQEQTELALAELQIPELNPNKAFEWSGDLFTAYADVLGDLGREEESAQWRKRAAVADEAIAERLGLAAAETIEIFSIYEDYSLEAEEEAQAKAAAAGERSLAEHEEDTDAEDGTATAPEATADAPSAAEVETADVLASVAATELSVPAEEPAPEENEPAATADPENAAEESATSTQEDVHDGAVSAEEDSHDEPAER
ncbi:hypothetical protein KXZ72_06045 [Mycetocola spongiae]|nr:hypothetical protein KXZ72_06045 [Mycetocola spongiae]